MAGVDRFITAPTPAEGPQGPVLVTGVTLTGRNVAQGQPSRYYAVYTLYLFIAIHGSDVYRNGCARTSNGLYHRPCSAGIYANRPAGSYDANILVL